MTHEFDRTDALLADIRDLVHYADLITGRGRDANTDYQIVWNALVSNSIPNEFDGDFGRIGTQLRGNPPFGENLRRIGSTPGTAPPPVMNGVDAVQPTLTFRQQAGETFHPRARCP